MSQKNGKVRILGILVALATSLTAASTAQPGSPMPPGRIPSIDLPSELDRVLRDYEEAWRARDPGGLAELFAEDGFVLSPGWPPVRGRSNIQRRYEGRGGALVLRALAYATEGNVGYIIGAYAREEGGQDLGKFTLTLRRVGRRWLIMSDMDNGNTR